MSGQLRILMAADVLPDSGGVADHAQALSAALRQRGHIVEPFWASSLNRNLPGPLRTVGFSLALAKELRRTRPDVVHAHTSSGALAHSLAPRLMVTVTTSHGDERALWAVERAAWRAGHLSLKPWSHVLVPGVRLPLFAAAVRTPDGVIALHDLEAAVYANERGGARPVHVIPNAPRRSLGRGTPVPGRIVFVGSWIWRKGSTTLVSAFTRLRRQDSSCMLYLVGPGPEALTDFPIDVRDGVRARGYLPHDAVDQEVAAADVLVLPSAFEGMPLVVLDALAQGVPVVATDLPGTRATIGARAGLLVPDNDVDALADALWAVVRDRGARERMSAAAVADTSGLDWLKVADRTLRLYAAAAASPRPGRVLGRSGRIRHAGLRG